MTVLVLLIIYLAFISLGLPDSLLGAAWPVMRAELGLPVSYAGLLTMLISAGTIASSLLSDRLTRRFGAGLVTAVSVGMTAAALFGFAASRSFAALCLWCLPYGLGAGAVDAALNNYVALHYAARHMSWLHSFWGVGTSVSPYIMSRFLTRQAGWPGGYRAVGLLQVGLTALLFLSLPLWRRREGTGEERTEPLSPRRAVKMPGVPYILLAFFGYCALESTCGLWASSYLVEARGIDSGTAARFASLFYTGITAGRFVSGFLTDRLGDRRLIRLGTLIALAGALLVLLPHTPDPVPLAGLVVVGLGCAPIYPSIIHATPDNFGRENSQAVIGVQMAAAYLGTTLMPPAFGLVARHVSMGLYPAALALFGGLILVMTERLNRLKKRGETR